MKIKELLNILLIGLLNNSIYQEQEFDRASSVLSDLYDRASEINLVVLDLDIRCITWSEFKQFVQNRTIRLQSPVPEVPSGYQNGCLLAFQGEQTLIVHIFENGVELEDLPIENCGDCQYSEREIYSVIPAATQFNLDTYILSESGNPRKNSITIIFDSIWQNSIAYSAKNSWDIARGEYIIFYRTIVVSINHKNDDRQEYLQREMKRLLEETSDRWTFSWEDIFNVSNNDIDNTIDCKLENWQPDEVGSARFILTVTNHSDRSQNFVLVELGVRDKDRNYIGFYPRRFQGFIFDLDPPLEVGETRNLSGGRKYGINWNTIDIEACKWLDFPQEYFERYPELIYIPYP